MPRTYKTSSGVYDIPDAEAQAFLKDNPDAVEVASYIMGKDTFDIPLGEEKDFLKDNPGAKPVKKKEGTAGETSSPPSERSAESGASGSAGIIGNKNNPFNVPGTPTPLTGKKPVEMATKIPAVTAGADVPAGQIEVERKLQESLSVLPDNDDEAQIKTGLQRNQAQRDQKRIPQWQSRMAAFNKTVYAEAPAAVLDWVAANAKHIDPFKEYEGKKLEDLATYKLARQVEQWGKEMFPENPEFQNDFADQVVKGGGQLASMFLTGGAGGAMGAASLPIMQQGADEYKAAYQSYTDAKDLTQDEFVQKYAKAPEDMPILAEQYRKVQENKRTAEDLAYDNMLFGMAAGSLEMIPVAKFFRKADKLTGNQMKKFTASTEGRIFSQGLEEGMQEFASQIILNKTAQETYDATRKLQEGAVDAGMVGFTLGALTGGLVSAVQQKADRATDPQEKGMLTRTVSALQAGVEGSQVTSPEIQELEKRKEQLETQMVNEKLPDEAKDAVNDRVGKLEDQIGEMREKAITQKVDAEFKIGTSEAIQAEIGKLQPLLESDLQDETKAAIQEKINTLQGQLKEFGVAEPGDQPASPGAEGEKNTTENQKDTNKANSPQLQQTEEQVDQAGAEVAETAAVVKVAKSIQRPESVFGGSIYDALVSGDEAQVKEAIQNVKDQMQDSEEVTRKAVGNELVDAIVTPPNSGQLKEETKGGDTNEERQRREGDQGLLTPEEDTGGAEIVPPVAEPTPVTAKNVVDLIKEAVSNNTKKVRVTFQPITEQDLGITNAATLEKFKHIIGTQKVEEFDVDDEALDILDLVGRIGKDVQSVEFVKGEPQNVTEKPNIANNEQTAETEAPRVQPVQPEPVAEEVTSKPVKEKPKPPAMNPEQLQMRKDALRMSLPQFLNKYPDADRDQYFQIREGSVSRAPQKTYAQLTTESEPQGRIQVDPTPNPSQQLKDIEDRRRAELSGARVKAMEDGAELTPEAEKEINARFDAEAAGAGKRKPKRLDEIVLDLSKGVKKDILKSKSPSGRAHSLGSYNPANSATKIRYNNDLDTTAHEIAHALDDRYKLLALPEEGIERIMDELAHFSQFGSQPPEGHPNPDKYRFGEGIAEWLRAYIVNPEEARQQGPEFYHVYEMRVPEEIRQEIDNFSADVRAYAGMTNIDKLKATVNFDLGKRKGPWGRLMDHFKPSTTNEGGFSLTYGDRMRTVWVNSMRPAEKAFEFARGEQGVADVLPKNDPRVMARLFLGINSKMDRIFEDGMIDPDNDPVLDPVTEEPMTLNWLLDPLDATDEKTLNKEMEEVATIMIAQRVKEKYDIFKRENDEAAEAGKPKPHPNLERIVNAGGGVFKNMDVVNKALEDFSDSRVGDPVRFARYNTAMSRFREYADALMQYMVKSGRLSEGDYNAIKENNAWYVGLGRVMDAGPNERIVTSPRGTGNIGSVTELNSFKGSERMVKNPYEYLIDTAYRVIKESDRNRVMQGFADILRSDREMYEGEPNKLATVGRQVSSASEPNTITIFANGEAEHWQFDDDVYAALKNLQDVAYTLPGVVTALPRFLRWSVTNFPVFAARNRVRDFQSRMILNAHGTKVSDFRKSPDLKRRYDLYGGNQSGYYLKDDNFYYEKLRNAMRDMAEKTSIISPDILKRGWQAYQNLLSKSERATRLEQYNAAYRKGKEKGLDDYNANLYAAYEARDLMDFAIAGTWMRTINQVVPFSNAAVQGMRKMLLTAEKDPGGFAIRMLLFSFIPAMLTRMIAHWGEEDDKWYKELPAYQRDLFYNYRMGDNLTLSVPKPYELGVMGSFGERMLDRFLYDNPNAFDGHAGTMARSFFPFDESTLAGPVGGLVEASANYDFFRHKHIVPTYEENKAVEFRNDGYASRLGQALGAVTGSDARVADFMVKRLASYYGDLAIRLSDIGRKDKDLAFGLETTGFFKSTPGPNAASVDWLLERAKEYGIDQMPPYMAKSNMFKADYQELKELIKTYYSAKSDHDRQEIADTIIDFAERTRKEWEQELPKLRKALLDSKK